MAERKLFTLTLKEIGGGPREVSLLLDEAVSDNPDFLVAAISEMKATLAEDMRARLAENPIDRFPDAGYTSQDEPDLLTQMDTEARKRRGFPL